MSLKLFLVFVLKHLKHVKAPKNFFSLTNSKKVTFNLNIVSALPKQNPKRLDSKIKRLKKQERKNSEGE